MIRLFPGIISGRSLGLFVSEILWMFGAFIVASYFALPADPSIYLFVEGGMISVTLAVLSIIIGLYFQNLYSDIHVKSKVVLLQQLCLVVGVAFLIQGMISYLIKLRMPVRLMACGSGIAMAVVFLWRVFYSAWVLQVVRERLLLVGGSSVLLDIARHLADHPEMAASVAGYVDDVNDPDIELPGGKLLGRLASLTEIVKATRPDRVVVGMFERRNRAPMNELLELRFSGHLIEEASSAYERVCGRVCIKELRPSQLVYSGELGPRPQTLAFHNFINMVIAVTGIVLASPVMLLTALAVRLTSRGPILYRQARIGRNEVPFTVYKFRSMRVDAEASTGAVWATRDDPRVTPVGRFIRRRRFDELPQLFNVLKGDMSIVGPRPERPEFVKALSEQIPYYRQRHCVRPGITGWAQINYKYGDSLDDTVTKLEYDLFYIKNMSVSLDALIIFHSIKAMLFTEGVH